MTEILSQGWVSSLIGLIGIVLALFGLFAYRAARIGPRLACQLRSRRLIGKEEQELPQEVDILFKKQPVPRLTLSHIVFWNSGKATIPGEHVVRDDPIRLEFDQEDDILQANVLKVSRKVTKINVQKNEAYQAIVTFDYLDPGDGAVLELLHTSKHRNPKILGTIRGLPQGIRSFSQFSDARFLFLPRRSSKTLFTSMFTMIALVGLIAVVVSFLPQDVMQFIRTSLGKDTVTNEEWTFTIGKRSFIFILGLLYATPALSSLWLRRKRFPKSLQVPDLEV